MKNIFIITIGILSLISGKLFGQEILDREKYMPIPMPQVTEAVHSQQDKNHVPQIISIDIKSRSQQIKNIQYTPSGVSESVSDFLPIDELPSGNNAPLPEGFTALSLATNLESFPQRTTVKLFMKFSNGKNYVGSGALIDSKHVLTAGHCIYSHADGGWATEVIVVPSYDSGSEPFGRSTAKLLTSNTNWTQSGDYNYDCGIIELHRPVGGITGWLGYGFNTNNSVFTNNTFYNYCYPGESPYNGQKMYLRSGNFDWVYPDLVYFPGKGYGGTSGSCSFFNNGSYGRTVYSIHSHTETIGNNQRAGQVRLNEWKFNQIKNLVDNNTPNGNDLVPLRVRVTDSKVVAGAPTNFSLLLHNYSKNSFSGNVTFNVYLSSNDIISSTDYFVGTVSTYVNISAKQTQTVSFNATLTNIQNYSGDWAFMGVTLQNQDANTANNNTNAFDATQVMVIKNAANDEPCGATPLSVYSFPLYSVMNNQNATETVFPTANNICNQYNSTSIDRDVWATATMPASGRMTVITRAGTLTDGVMYVYGATNNSCNNLYYVKCEDDNNPGAGQFMPVITVYGPAGARVYIRMMGYNGSFGTFDIAVVDYETNGLQDDGGDPENYQLAEPDPSGLIYALEDALEENNKEKKAVATERAGYQNDNPISLVSAPNPFSSETEIRFTLADEAQISLQIFNASGAVIDAPIADYQTFGAGVHTIRFSGEGLPSGVYFARLTAGHSTLTHKMVLQK